MTPIEILDALKSADPRGASGHHSADERIFWRLPTAAGELRYEEREGWIMDQIAIGSHLFRPLDLRESGTDVVDLLSDIMRAVNTAWTNGDVPAVLDLSRDAAARFVQTGV